MTTTTPAEIVPSVTLTAEEGSQEITDEWIVRAPARLLTEFERALLDGCRRHRLSVLVSRDLLRRTILITWRPATDPRQIGVWRIA